MGTRGGPAYNRGPLKMKHRRRRGGGGERLVRRIKFPWLICCSSCREVKVKANPAVRGARIKVFEIWIQGLSGSQYQGLSIVSVDRRINTPRLSFPSSSRRFLAELSWGPLLLPPNDMVGAAIRPRASILQLFWGSSGAAERL
ncbi:Hypothetical predicted protein [Xyrichtys novacula]|uniref:Ribosomal protein L2 n=1 Tax=Xyrichtys novacula TaxID=13765 RepID=A0AAV1GM25_XYRNO|nr:Hypothetical predicted protein [Xyrichtys novacula]